MAHALQHTDENQQLALYSRGGVAGLFRRSVDARVRRTAAAARPAPLCAGCRSREARYGFRDAKAGELRYDRPRTLCFECFRVEIDRRRAVAAQLARGWNAEQAPLPLEDTLRDLTRRRRRAQIAARHALELR
jgi:hypothetical protein